MKCWLIGAGQMAQDYARVLRHLGRDFEVIGRQSASAEKFEVAIGVPVHCGGISAALAGGLQAPEQAIVAVNVERLAGVALELIRAGTRHILLEKPGGLNLGELQEIQRAALETGARILIAYNRRFYASTIAAREWIKRDGGVTSCIFEFTEWPHTFLPLHWGPGVKEAWLLSNSSHVPDLAFHFCGFPRDWGSWHEGALEWHPAAARFCGAGVTEKGALFSYHADWEAPGRWEVEVLTRKRRLILRPLERLQMVLSKSTEVQTVEIDDSLDKQFRPGLYKQVQAFFEKEDLLFCTLNDQIRYFAIYNKMAGY